MRRYLSPRVAAVLGAVGLMTITTAAAAQSIEERCSNQAFVSCQTDQFGNPIFVTVECFDSEYQACIASAGGGEFGAFREQ